MFGDITDAERLGWQRRAVTCLAELLKLAAKENLPPVSWRVAPHASVVAEFYGVPNASRREALGAWKTAIAAVACRGPDHDTEHSFASGETRLIAGWRYLPVKLAPADGPAPGVDVTLVASIWPDEEGEQ